MLVVKTPKDNASSTIYKNTTPTTLADSTAVKALKYNTSHTIYKHLAPMASGDETGEVPAHKCSIAIPLNELRGAVHKYAKDNNISDLAKKKDVQKKTRAELVDVIREWPDFPTRACCAIRDMPKGIAALRQRQSLAAMAERHDHDMLDETATLIAMVDDTEKDASEEEVGVGKFTVPATVKMKLATFVKDNGVLKYIRTLPPLVNRLEGEAYAFGNFYILRLLKDAKAELPVIDSKFYYRCINAVAKNNARKGTLTQSWLDAIAAFDLRRPADGRPKVDITGTIFNQIVGTMSKKMATMATNHLAMNLSNRLLTYLSWKYPRLKKLRHLIVAAVLLIPTTSLEEIFVPKPDGSNTTDADRARNAKLVEAKAVAKGFRDIMPLKGKTQYASRAHHTLRFYHHIMTETETAMENQERNDRQPSTSKDAGKKKPGRIRFKPFTMLPTKDGYTISYVSISAAAFINILKKLDRVKTSVPNGGEGLDYHAKRKIWARFCNLNAVETRSRLFNCSVVTDGCAVSIIMAKCSSLICPDLGTAAIEEARCHPGANMVAVDPGYTDTVVIARKTLADDGNDCGCTTSSYSSVKYYERSKVNLSRRRTDRWNEETAAQASSVTSPRTVNLDKMATYLTTYLRELPGLIDHRMTKGYRNMRFMRFIFKQKAVHEICDLIAPNTAKTRPPHGKEWSPSDHTIVFFGDWKGGNGTPISRRASGPLQEIKFELMSRARVTVVMVDEFKTSITCHRCQGRLVNMRAAKTTRIKWRQGVKTTTEMHGQKVHAILHCKSSGCCKASTQNTMDRDVNASQNILNIGVCELEGKPRPAAMCRSKDEKSSRKRNRA